MSQPTNYPDGVTSFGMLLLGGGGIPATFGQVWFVDYNNGSDGNTGKTRDKAFKTLNAAYSAAVTNRGDIILLSSNSSHQLSSALDWSKNRITVIGFDGFGRSVQQGTKVQTTSSETTAYVIKITGNRNAFKNIKWIQNSTEATALTVVQEGGEGTVMEGCSITFGVADNLDQATAYELLFGGDSCTYRRVQIG